MGLGGCRKAPHDAQRCINILPSSQASHHHLLSCPRGAATLVGISKVSLLAGAASSCSGGINLNTLNR